MFFFFHKIVVSIFYLYFCQTCIALSEQNEEIFQLNKSKTNQLYEKIFNQNDDAGSMQHLLAHRLWR